MMLETTRCRIRLFQPEDITRFMEYRNNDEWMRFQGFKNRSRTEYEAELLSNGSFDIGMQLALAERESDRLIGDLYVQRDGPDYWLGVSVHPSHSRQGYAAEAVTALLPALKKLRGRVAKASIIPGNNPSIALFESLLFTRGADLEDGRLVYYKDLEDIL